MSDIVAELKRRERTARLRANRPKVSLAPPKQIVKRPQEKAPSQPRTPAQPRVSAPEWTYDYDHICECAVDIISKLVAPKHSLKWLKMNDRLTPELHVLLTTPLEDLAR